MWPLSLLLGSDTVSWYARLALRSLVSMSATGSVMVIWSFSLSNGFGLAPWCGARPGWVLVGRVGLREREAELAQQGATLVIRLGGGDDRDVEAANAVDLVLVDLVEDALLGDTEGVVAVAVELLVTETAEVADARERERQQPVEELPCPVAAQRDVGADRHPLAELELGDRLAGLGDLRLLTGDQRQVFDGAIDHLGVASCLADTGVHDDLDETRHLVHVRVVELLGQVRGDLAAVLLLQARLASFIRRRVGRRGTCSSHLFRASLRTSSRNEREPSS